MKFKKFYSLPTELSVSKHLLLTHIFPRSFFAVISREGEFPFASGIISRLLISSYSLLFTSTRDNGNRN